MDGAMDVADEAVGDGPETGLVVNTRHISKFLRGALHEVRTTRTRKRNVPIHLWESGSGAKLDGAGAWVRRFTATLVTCKELPPTEWSATSHLHLNEDHVMAKLAEPDEPGGDQKKLYSWILADIMLAGNELTHHRGRSVWPGG
eukprot:4236456-Pyramimonas_sp.AAC.1